MLGFSTIKISCKYMVAMIFLTALPKTLPLQVIERLPSISLLRNRLNQNSSEYN